MSITIQSHAFQEKQIEEREFIVEMESIIVRAENQEDAVLQALDGIQVRLRAYPRIVVK